MAQEVSSFWCVTDKVAETVSIITLKCTTIYIWLHMYVHYFYINIYTQNYTLTIYIKLYVYIHMYIYIYIYTILYIYNFVYIYSYMFILYNYIYEYICNSINIYIYIYICIHLVGSPRLSNHPRNKALLLLRDRLWGLRSTTSIHNKSRAKLRLNAKPWGHGVCLLWDMFDMESLDPRKNISRKCTTGNWIRW